MAYQKNYGSFRDPSGFIYYENGKLYRQVNKTYANEYEKLMKGGLYKELTDKGYLVKHKEVGKKQVSPGAYKTIQPEKIDFISYPYE
ncbi:MAG: SAM-dependent methyltransferase, partial [Acidobacteriota bacterium]